MSEHLNRATLEGFDELGGEARREAVEHLRDCAICRAELAAIDPTALFSLLSLQPVPEEILDQVSAGVRQEIAAEGQVERQPKRWLGWAGVAAAALIVGVLAVRGVGTPGTDPVEPEVFPPVTVVEQQRLQLLDPGEGVEVVDLTVGDAQLVMVFDKGLEL
ncbi:hypothetical protein ABI59_02040 [Acidobacteria bacterium Mor1]|nr:hypothetical protein ABI59_02040 [Acidobacteria bacterium Mor1]